MSSARGLETLEVTFTKIQNDRYFNVLITDLKAALSLCAHKGLQG